MHFHGSRIFISNESMEKIPIILPLFVNIEIIVQPRIFSQSTSNFTVNVATKTAWLFLG